MYVYIPKDSVCVYIYLKRAFVTLSTLQKNSKQNLKMERAVGVDQTS